MIVANKREYRLKPHKIICKKDENKKSIKIIDSIIYSIQQNILKKYKYFMIYIL